VIFKGKWEGLLRAEQLFDEMMKKEKSEDKGQLPDFIIAETGYFFELWRMGNMVMYETRWCPNTETLKQIADHFGISFTHQFSEPMTGILGQVYYSDGEFKT
jgi:hypothetical protein